MEPQTPQSLKIAAVAQIVSGCINLTMGWWIGSCTLGTCCGAMTLGFGGQLCGLVPLLLVPLGLIEIGIGAYTLSSPREAASIQKLVGFFEIGSVLLGGLGSMLCGVAVVLLHNRDETVAYLEG